MAAWPIKFAEGSKSGKKHPLPIDLSTENKNFPSTKIKIFFSATLGIRIFF
jgi:hypothetical protein